MKEYQNPAEPPLLAQGEVPSEVIKAGVIVLRLILNRRDAADILDALSKMAKDPTRVPVQEIRQTLADMLLFADNGRLHPTMCEIFNAAIVGEGEWIRVRNPVTGLPI